MSSLRGIDPGEQQMPTLTHTGHHGCRENDTRNFFPLASAQNDCGQYWGPKRLQIHPAVKPKDGYFDSHINNAAIVFAADISHANAATAREFKHQVTSPQACT